VILVLFHSFSFEANTLEVRKVIWVAECTKSTAVTESCFGAMRVNLHGALCFKRTLSHFKLPISW